MQLIETQLGDDLFKDRKGVANLQTHEKVERISAIVRELENNLLKSLDLFTSLNRVKAHRENLMSVLNGRLGRFLFQPFLPNSLDSLMIEFYKRIEEYTASKDSSGIVEARRAVLDEATRFQEVLAAYGTSYATLLDEKVIKHAIDLVEQDFSTNQAAQPAIVLIRLKEKKYPLHVSETKIQIGLLVDNQGPGYAHDILITIVAGDDNLSIHEEYIEVGRLPPGTSQLIEVPSTVLIECTYSHLCVDFAWKDFDGTSHISQLYYTLSAQRADVDWARLVRSDPYSLEPVLSERDLIGRKDVLNRLIGAAQAASVSSTIIYGQKRVGKTSIARALQSHLKDQGFIVLFLEGGDYVEPNSKATISRLGIRICKDIAFADSRTTHIPIPIFNEALSPLVDYLIDVLRVNADIKMFFILDEFDELPIELYVRGAIGDSFFLTLRAISSKSNIGFVVVGSEKMAHVIDCQGDKLNKWKVLQVDYFSREIDWPDYCDLIKRPVLDELDFTDGSLIALHTATSGNPYFTKLICQQILDTALQRRDSCITEEEVNRAVSIACNQIDKNSFQHFWEDGIFDSGPAVTDKSVRRRKILIALSDTLRDKNFASETAIAQHPLCKDIYSLKADLGEFVTRKVLIEKSSGYDFKVPFFGQWLRRKGIHDLISTFSDLDVVLQQMNAKEAHIVKSEEVVALVEKWKIYKGQSFSEDRVRAWIEQFGGPFEQRIMLKLLQGLRYYGTDVVRVRMSEAHNIVKRDIVWEVASGKSGKAKRSDILVSYLDGPAKSGAFLARVYADEARVYAENVLERKDIANFIVKSKSVKALVFLDDFVGTGKSATEYLKKVDSEIGDIIKKYNIKCYFITVVAYLEGWKKIEVVADNLIMNLQAHACEIINETSKCFSDHSEVFPDVTEREQAKGLALLYGKQLVSRNPLGYGDLELAIVFERGCPNNSIPILWADSGKPKWVPLFKRK